MGRLNYEHPQGSIADFILWLRSQGMSGADVCAAREWIHWNRPVWEAFEPIALEFMKRGERISAKEVLEKVRRQLKIEIVNACTPLLARMFNFKHGLYFDTAKIKGIKLTRKAA